MPVPLEKYLSANSVLTAIFPFGHSRKKMSSKAEPVSFSNPLLNQVYPRSRIICFFCSEEYGPEPTCVFGLYLSYSPVFRLNAMVVRCFLDSNSFCRFRNYPKHTKSKSARNAAAVQFRVNPSESMEVRAAIVCHPV